MKILHGSWIPQAEEAFIQPGAFYLWVETTEQKQSRQSSQRQSSQRHPRHSAAPDLATLLTTELGIQPPPHGSIQSLISPQYFLLPTVGAQPLPSLELSRYWEEELPESFEFQYWQIDCYPIATSAKTGGSVNRVVSLLNDLHFLALHNLAEIQLGADLLFWFHYTQALKRIIFKDQYIPALIYRDLGAAKTSGTQRQAAKWVEESIAAAPATRSRRAKTTATTARTGSLAAQSKKQLAAAQALKVSATSAAISAATSAATSAAISAATSSASPIEIYSGWQFIGAEYETTIQQYVDYMPLICVAGMSQPQVIPAFYDRVTLLRHFSESLLVDVVTHLPTTQAFEKTIANSLLADCLQGSGKAVTASLVQYQQWQAWRDRIARTQSELSFHLYFKLQDPANAQDSWELQFQVAPKGDPSLRLSLHDYWRMRSPEQKQIQQQMGAGFEQQLLMNLGYAARIYPALWEGLETDQPIGIGLDLESAFAFLKESAWVLENAGYKVVVPAWYTPQGRQRAKVRLKTRGKSLTGGEDKSKQYFSFEQLVEYQYDLAIGGQPVSEQEWNQLVSTKTPLVQFRGQWLELDQDRMRQMLEFWKTQQQEHPELSLLDFLKLTTGADDDLELQVDRDGSLAEMLNKLGDKSQLQAIDNPQHLQGNLRDYQKRGVSWLQYLEQLGLNGCLADDMGLGKTIQVIARLLQERELAAQAGVKNIPPTLLIAPTSVLGNWYHEIQKFAPQLQATIHHGSQRAKASQAFKQACRENDLLITSFALARLDAKLLSEINYSAGSPAL